VKFDLADHGAVVYLTTVSTMYEPEHAASRETVVDGGDDAAASEEGGGLLLPCAPGKLMRPPSPSPYA
jgi:hypothetical protein